MVKIRICVLIAVFWTSGFSAESKILSYLGKFMPNFTEIAFVTNIVNVYLQVSAFVRETNNLLKSVKQTQQEWNQLTSQMNSLYGTIKSLRNVNLYDMDSWAQTLDRAEIVLRYDIKDVMQTFNMLEYYSLDATQAYVQHIDNLNDYAQAEEQKRVVVKKYFLSTEYQTALATFGNTMATYMKSTKELLEQELNNETVILANETDPKKKAEEELEIASLQDEIQKIDAAFQSDIHTTKLDTILDESSDMITTNLTEIQLAAQKIKEMEDKAMSLVDSYEKLKAGNISTNAKPIITQANVNIDLNKYSSTSPDSVPVPPAPENTTPKSVQMKQVGNEDVQNMQNGIGLLLFKQESLLRDVEIMKANTMAFILSLESYRQNNLEQDAFVLAHAGKKIELGMK
jgi:uncharacterized membrane protein